jgi:uncharacterized protein YyaL (SSP411 family)
MANRLAQETSHTCSSTRRISRLVSVGRGGAAARRDEQKPILLSVGYAACHCCHVMARESFEDPDTAGLMNSRFVNVKVDREERPDLDSIYMQAVQSMTGQGGWPMTVFLTPDGEPFYGGTYFPPEDRHGMPGFPRILRSVADVWESKRGDVARAAAAVREVYAAGAPATEHRSPKTEGGGGGGGVTGASWSARRRTSTRASSR